MDATEVLKQKLPGFAGYAALEQRRLTDEEVRAYLGERLAGLSVRLEPTGPTAERLDALILRAEFTNQMAFRNIESTNLDAAQTETIATADLAAVELADRADSVFDVDMLPSYLDAAEAALNARDSAMESGGNSR
ncbi:MAG TPA: hypothetical protein VMB20_04570 [Candidatus Acidoferrum sp.]|nr:hypothetical protein [Candidatus Acidoferrum sp.]